jgi:hypothetical protein
MPTPPAAPNHSRGLPVSALALIGAGCLVVALGIGVRLTTLRREKPAAQSKKPRSKKQ